MASRTLTNRDISCLPGTQKQLSVRTDWLLVAPNRVLPMRHDVGEAFVLRRMRFGRRTGDYQDVEGRGLGRYRSDGFLGCKNRR